MIDKDIKDYCKNCDVEPPAMRFKCPECEHNPDKEQIIIDGVDVSGCSVYKNGKCLISKAKCNARCDYGAIYLKEQLARKTQECESLKEEVQILQDNFDTVTRDCNDLIDELRQECEKKNKEINGLNIIIERLLEVSGYDKNTSTAEDFEDVYADIDYKLGLLDELKQECEELKGKYKNVLDLAKQNADANEYCLQELEQENYRYRKALEEIEKATKINCEEICGRKFEDCNDFLCPSKNIIDIINKAKGDNR